MTDQQRFASPRSQMISARQIVPSLRVNEYQLLTDHLHLLVLISGEMEIVGANVNFSVTASSRVFLPKGLAKTVRLQAGSRLAWVNVNEIGLAHAMPQSMDTSNLRQLLARPISKSLAKDERAHIMQDIDTIALETMEPQPGSDVITTNLFSILLVRLWRKAVGDTGATSSAHGNLLDQFVQLYQIHRREHWTVDQYCQKLGTSRDRLQTAVLRATGLTPQTYIHQSILNEARDLLRNTSLQINEIAFRLGYQDPAYFNRFFTRANGVSPGRFRKEMLQSGSQDMPSFASWP
jgi:AraC family transcriptional activator of pobA